LVEKKQGSKVTPGLPYTPETDSPIENFNR